MARLRSRFGRRAAQLLMGTARAHRVLAEHSGGSSISGMQLNQVTGNVELLTIGCMIAIGTARAALRLYEKRAGTQIPL